MLLEIVSIFGIILANVICYLCHDKSILRFKLKGPNILFISNRSAAAASKHPSQYWALDVLDPQHLVSSLFLNDVCVLLLRCASLGFFILTVALEGLTGDGFGAIGNWFTFFTNWTFLLFGLWSVLGVILTATHLQVKLNLVSGKGSGGRAEEFESLTADSGTNTSLGPVTDVRQPHIRWGPLNVTYLLMTETVATASVFLSFFYWMFLFSPKAPIEIDNLLKHGINNIVLLFEVFLCRTPFISYHFQAILAYGTVYLIFMWIYHGASSKWVYWVLDWSKPTATVLYLLNPFFLVTAFLFWYFVAALREKIGYWMRPNQLTTLQQVDFQ